MKIIDLGFCNKEYAQADTYSTWNKYSDWSYNQRPATYGQKSNSDRIKAHMKDTDSRNNPKQVDYVHVRVKKSKHHSYKKKRPEDNHDIENWTVEQVKRWISNTCHSHCLPAPYPVDNYLMNGKGLLMLTKKDFINRSQMCGDILYEALVSIRSENEFKAKDYQSLKTVSNNNNNEKTYARREYSNYMPAYEVEYIDEENDKLYDYLACLNNISLNSIGIKGGKPKFSSQMNPDYFHYSTFQ